MPTLSETYRDDESNPPHGARLEPSLHVVLEGGRLLAGGLRASLRGIDEVRFVRGRERTWTPSDRSAILEVPDPRMSGKHARLVRVPPSSWMLEDLGSTNGTFVDGVRVPRAMLVRETVITLGATAFLFSPEEPTTSAFPALVEAGTLRTRPRGTATLVPRVEVQIPRLLRVTASDLPVLLLGESGVGKEVLARMVHESSGRSGAFVAINCAALTPNLLESQLFGHVKGAFSGALRDEPGLVRAAQGGTLFLDEIGELPASAQATLLRVLQEREVLPVGGTKAVPVDFRVVAATLKSIEDATAFRQDLYARISAFVYRVPPLRERRADIGLLIADMLPRLAPTRAESLQLAPDLVTALVLHSWPLNVRQLEQALSVALVTQPGDYVRLEDAGTIASSRASEEPRPDAGGAEENAESNSPARELTEDESRLKAELVEALTRTSGNVSQVSREMGKTRMQIHRWMRRFGIEPESFR